MGRFDISPEVEAEYRQKFRDSVQPHVDGEVLAVGPFRPTGAGTEYAISKTQAGALAYGAASLIGKKRAGGLPGRFLLAVTPSKLYAFKYKQKRSGIEVKDQVAEWDRAGTKASADARSTTKRVTIETGESDKIVCDAEGLGHNPWPTTSSGCSRNRPGRRPNQAATGSRRRMRARFGCGAGSSRSARNWPV